MSIWFRDIAFHLHVFPSLIRYILKRLCTYETLDLGPDVVMDSDVDEEFVTSSEEEDIADDLPLAHPQSSVTSLPGMYIRNK